MFGENSSRPDWLDTEGAAEENALETDGATHNHSSTPADEPTRVRLYGGRLRKGVFTQPRGPNAFLRKPPSIAFDAALLAHLRRRGVHTVRVVARATGQVYTASLDTIYSKGLAFNRGFGEQIRLALEDWEVVGGKAA